MEHDKKEGEVMREVIVEQVGQVHPMESALDTQKVVAKLGAIADAIAAYAKRSIQNTNPKDWVKMGDGYYLQASGAQKIRPIWGCYYRNRQVIKEVNPDGSYSYLVTGEVGSQVLDKLYFGEVVVEIEGGRSSSDPFFGKSGRTPDPLDVRKAALSNWEARAITGLLGLKNMSQEDLKKNGLDVSQIQSVSYQKGAEGGGDTSVISEAQGKRLFAIAQKSSCDLNRLKAHLKEKYGIDSSAQIKRSDYDKIVAWAQAGGQYGPEEGAK